MNDELKAALIEFYKATVEFWTALENGLSDVLIEKINERIDKAMETIKGFGV